MPRKKYTHQPDLPFDAPPPEGATLEHGQADAGIVVPGLDDKDRTELAAQIDQARADDPPKKSRKRKAVEPDAG